MCDNKFVSGDTNQGDAPVVEINSHERMVFNLEAKATKPYDFDLMSKQSPTNNTNNNTSNTENGGD